MLVKRINIGFNAGSGTQGTGAVAIGQNAGFSVQGQNAVAIGSQSGQVNQQQFAIAVGFQSGSTGQGTNATALGFNAGSSLQGQNAIAVGFQAGQFGQGTNAIAIGQNAGQTNQGTNAIAIGFNAGYTNQGINAIAIGFNAGQTNQAQYAIAIGFQAAVTNQGINAIAIGNFAGHTNQPANSIIFNARTAPYTLAPANANSCYVAPVRSDGAATTLSLLMYNSRTSEVMVSTNTTASGSKTFVIDHPTDANKYLVHSCLEGPEAGVYYRGKGVILNNESTIITLPKYASNLAYDFSIQLTPIYDESCYSDLLRCSLVVDNSFTVYGNNCRFYWIAHATRANIEVEPLKSESVMKGSGPYKWL